MKQILDMILNSFTGSSDNIDVNADVSGFIDSVIRTAMEKRASDIHIEPMQEGMRIRYRIDGVLINAVNVGKEKQSQIIGRLKAISNMHQEKTGFTRWKNYNVSRTIIYVYLHKEIFMEKNLF